MTHASSIVAIVGALVLILGVVLLVSKSAIVLLAGYKPGKYDDAKLGKFVGWHLLALGLITIFCAAIYEIAPEYENGIWIAMTIATLAIVAKLVWGANKHYRLK